MMAFANELTSIRYIRHTVSEILGDFLYKLYFLWSIKTMTDELTVEELRRIADDLSIKWNAANKAGTKEAREEIGERLYETLRTIEKRTGEWYRPVEEVDSL